MVCKVMKKGVVGAALAAGVLALLFGTAVPYYARTAVNKVRSTADEVVPMQFKIDRARQQVAELEPAIRQNIESIARAEVEIEYLGKEIASTQANLGHEGEALVALRKHMEDSDLRLTGGVSYTPGEIKNEMARRLDHYRTIKGLVQDKEEMLNQRKKALVAAREQNSKMRAEKVALLTEIEGIETRLRQIEATQASNEFTFDDSALARAKQSVAELNKEVEVLRRVSEQEGRYVDNEMPVFLIDPARNVAEEVDAEFGLDGSSVSRDGKSL